MPMTMLLPPLGASSNALGAADALIGGRAVGQDNLRRARMQPDQHRVGPQFQRVMHDVKTGRKVNGAVIGNRFLQHGRVIGLAVAFGAQITQIDPGIARRQRGQIGSDGRRHCVQRRGVKMGFDFRHGADVGIVQSVGKSLHCINRRRARQSVCHCHATRQRPARCGR